MSQGYELSLMAKKLGFIGCAEDWGKMTPDQIRIVYTKLGWELPPNIPPLNGYHVAKIEKGTYGEISKIKEEFDEFTDAANQKNRLMELVELSDLICAIDGYLQKHFNSQLTIEDLVIQAKATQRSFATGERK